VQAAIEAGIPAHVLSASLYSRFASRNNDEFGNRVLSAMRYKFGGHNEKPAK
jgi:6-phosphogluconate dehydrogenase